MDLIEADFIIKKYGKTKFTDLGKKELAKLITAMSVINFIDGKSKQIKMFVYHEIREIRKPDLIIMAQFHTKLFNIGD